MSNEEIKLKIKDALRGFTSGNLPTNAARLLNILGYTSEKRLLQTAYSPEEFLNSFNRNVARPLNPTKALVDFWKQVHFLFQLTADEIKASSQLGLDFGSKKKVDTTIIESYLFFALELVDRDYPRTDLATITREINKIFNMPVMILFRHGDTLTLSIIDRRVNKNDNTQDVLEKVTLIKDINLSFPHRAHIEILFDLSLNELQRQFGFANFVELHRAWQKALDSSILNKEFYKIIAEFFYRLTGKDNHQKELVLPSVGENDIKKCEDFAVRLIGRIIFCWFLKHKSSNNGIPLIPEEILSVKAVGKNPNYYHSTLEPLFFEIMNKPVTERNSVTIVQADKVPFLNGGLFAPHPEDFNQPSLINALKIPDYWFKQFFEVLERYKFTIDENTPIEEEIALDPEMLGRIFENLLAEVVPETGETARKSTGSYYTPRVIVDYMAEQSLKQYLITKINLTKDKIQDLFSYGVESNLTLEQNTAVVTALKEIRVIDPACGSGAFPMGILHRMLQAMEKVDPRLEIWIKLYLDTVDSTFRKIVIESVSRENWDYLRKLIIIRDCIYGVDIQSIAVEIAKLRCFLSLVVDEYIDDTAPNRGVKPLPNLEFKFVAANTLKGLPRAEDLQVLEGKDLIEALSVLRKKYFNGNNEEKTMVVNEFKQVQAEMLKYYLKYAIVVKTDLTGSSRTITETIATRTKKLSEWDPFSFKESNWFDPEWMFGIYDRFDIVIANPPYIFARNSDMKGITDEDKEYYYAYYNLAEYQVNLYPLFIEKGTSLLKNNGCLCFITPNNWLTINTNKTLRKFVLGQSDITIVNFYARVFESASVDSSIIIYRKAQDNKRVFLYEYTEDFQFINESDCNIFLSQPDSIINIASLKTTGATELMCKIESKSIKLGDLADVKAGLKAYEVGKGNPSQTDQMKMDRIYHSTHKISDSYIKYLDGKDVCRYRLGWSGEYLKYGDNLAAPRKDFRLYSTKRILVRQIPAKPPYCIHGCLTEEVALNDLNSINVINIGESPECILGILNSRLTSFWFMHKFGKMQRNTFPQFKVNELADFPLPENRNKKQNEIAKLVTHILVIKKEHPDKDTSELDKMIDQIIYELYDLTQEEIAVVEGNK